MTEVHRRGRYAEGQKNISRVFEFIKWWLDEKQYWPRTVDIAAGLDLDAESVRKHMRTLESEDRIRHAGKGDQSWVMINRDAR